MTDALVLCVCCMRFGCSEPGKCDSTATLPLPVGDASEALWLSFGAVFRDRPSLSERAADERAALLKKSL